MGILQQVDFAVFKRRETYIALGISVVLFSTIAYASLSMFGSLDKMFESDAPPAPIPDISIESLNRTGIEDQITDQNGLINIGDIDGVVIIDFMARDCSNCHYVQAHLEFEKEGWETMAEKHGSEITIIGYGAWYSESLSYLNESGEEYTVPEYPTGLGNSESGTLENGSKVDPVRLFTTGGTGQIPVVMLLDSDGYIIAKETTGTPTDGWDSFDSAVELAITSESTTVTEDLRIAWEEPGTSLGAVFGMGMLLSILVYFSPCAFPVLPGFISYYLSLGAREDELIESGKLTKPMPSSWLIGMLSGFGMWTFFILIGVIAIAMGTAFQESGLVHYVAIGIAILLIILGSLMLLGITSHLMGFVQRFVDKYSTTEADEVFTPRRNMYLYGIGYAAASIDCTAAAVLPFVVLLVGLGSGAIFSGLAGLMLGLLMLMIAVTMMVGLGRQVMINFLRRATGIIKLVGSWMMIMAGVVLTFYLTQAEGINSLIS
ncbi:MAG: hypothetical protein QGI21_05885 [Candidatus Poseidoniaceae archaeon]|jgi:cytochrome c-type biogenesis protein|nr:hypothetical protein [Candidatus Poseidoniaceae archaeon]